MRNIFPFSKNYFYSCNNEIDSWSLTFLSSQFPSSTLKKSIIKIYINLLSKLNLISILPRVNEKEELNLINYFDVANSDYLIFSQNVSLRKRKYCFRIRGDSTKFLKLIYGNEIKNIKNIFQAKKSMKDFDNFYCFFPNSIKERNNKVILEYDILPSGSELVKIKPFSLFDYFLKINKTNNLINTVSLDSIFKTKLWKEFDLIKGIDLFKFYVTPEIYKNNSFKFCLCHGDLGSENLFYHKGKYIIIDWEKFSLEAPIITDYLGIVLGNNSKIIISEKNKIKSENTLISFYKLNIKSDFSYSDFLLGLVFYLSTDFNLAFFLINNFTNHVD